MICCIISSRPAYKLNEMEPLKEKKQRFIPFRKTDIIEMCCDDGTLSGKAIPLFRNLSSLLSSIYHFQFHKSLELLKDCYAPVNPDADTKPVYPKTEKEKEELENTLVLELKNLLDAANFEEITKADLDRALREESLFKIRLQVDFDDFEKILFFRRGESVREETLVSFFGLRKKTITFINYDRVVIYVKYKDKSYFDQKERNKLFFTPGSTVIKLFRNIPRSDLEMLFPNTEVRMKTIDKLIIGVPAAIGGVVILATKLGATLVLTGALLTFWLGLRDKPVVLDQAALVGLAMGFGTLGAFLWKQFNNFKNRKIQFMKTLADNLYFKNLDNNTGVFHRLIDAAEEEECKEAILAYFFLLKSAKPLSASELDRNIETWFETQHGHVLDFEVHDAVEKLEKLGLVEILENKITAIPLEQALIRLDKTWDSYFDFNYTQ